MVRADKWIAKATPEQVVKVVPSSYFMGDKKLYIQSFLSNRPALSRDGLIPRRLLKCEARPEHGRILRSSA